MNIRNRTFCVRDVVALAAAGVLAAGVIAMDDSAALAGGTGSVKAQPVKKSESRRIIWKSGSTYYALGTSVHVGTHEHITADSFKTLEDAQKNAQLWDVPAPGETGHIGPTGKGYCAYTLFGVQQLNGKWNPSHWHLEGEGSCQREDWVDDKVAYLASFKMSDDGKQLIPAKALPTSTPVGNLFRSPAFTETGGTSGPVVGFIPAGKTELQPGDDAGGGTDNGTDNTGGADQDNGTDQTGGADQDNGTDNTGGADQDNGTDNGTDQTGGADQDNGTDNGTDRWG